MASPKTPTSTADKSQGMSLAERQKQAAQKLRNETIIVKDNVQTPVETPKATITTKVKSEISTPKVDRREELNRKTEQARKKIQEITTQVSEPPKSETVDEVIEPEIEDLAAENLSVGLDENISTSHKVSKNVFKNVSQTKKSSITAEKKKRKKRGEKKGGGRQKMEKKLNRQKILEFKYFARSVLDNPNIPEEHRSNILGQIIAKGERTSIESAIEFIQLKQAELILTEEVANSLIDEIKKISTRR